MEKIDFVVTWLDSLDPCWQRDIIKYKEVDAKGDQSNSRYRDWDLFKFWFRSIEKYAPWVNKVFLVTNGKFPDWINPNHPKLILVKHSDYIPAEFLPTFNSHTIEFFLHRIKGLSEHFVYFNDDCYLNSPVNPDYYFKNGLPCDENAETIYNIPRFSTTENLGIKVGLLVNIGVLNGHFNRKKTVKNSFIRWYGLHLGIIDKFMNMVISLDRQNRFVGFRNRHVEQPYLKSVFSEVWEAECDLLKTACTRFRGYATLTTYFFRYWQFASNKFYPIKLNKWRKYILRVDDLPNIINGLKNLKIKSICLNDEFYCKEEDYETVKPSVQAAFEEKFPNKCSFEL